MAEGSANTGSLSRGTPCSSPLLTPLRKRVDSFHQRGVGWDGVWNSVHFSQESQRHISKSQPLMVVFLAQTTECLGVTKSDHTESYSLHPRLIYLSPGGNSQTLCLPTNRSPQNLVAWSNNNHLIIFHGICGPGSQGWAQLGGSSSRSHEVVVSGKLALELHRTVAAGGMTKHLSLFSCSLRASPCDCFMCDSLGFLTAWWVSHRANTNIPGSLYYAVLFSWMFNTSIIKNIHLYYKLRTHH